ncbi:MAG: YkgJ family cysteine cluster protein [Cyanobacteria bacterium REEB65]|nr:YkgJ family cysteine cluster protein [Cyanobacteria bacterium REEB65]
MPCNGCGACCNPVGLHRDISKAAIERGEFHPCEADREWILRDLKRIPKAEAIRRNPLIATTDQRNFYECRNFDPLTRLCLRYDDRPPVCSGFPWYGKPPDADRLVGMPDCGYRDEL